MADGLAEAALTGWRGMGRLLAPALPFVLALRTRWGKEDATRRGERFGRAGLTRPAGPLVWVHAASVGETIAVLPLIERLVAAGDAVLLTTGTVTSAAIAAQRLPGGAIHQYVPLDVVPWVSRFLDHWRPRLAVFVESEIWPTCISELSRRGIPQVLVNGRISARSARRWSRFGAVSEVLFGRLTGVAAQSQGDGERFTALGAAAVSVSGNLKFDGAPLPVDGVELARLEAAMGPRPRWLAASTHPGEEAVAADVHARLKAILPDLLTVIAPRHPTRGDELRRDFTARGLSVASRSLGETPTAATDVYLTDTIGEMGLIYRLAPIAYVGGSLVSRGGQNPIEPARLGRAVLHGPETYNFADVYRELDHESAAVLVRDGSDLAREIGSLLAAPEAIAAQVARAEIVVSRSTGALDRTMTALADWSARSTEAA